VSLSILGSKLNEAFFWGGNLDAALEKRWQQPCKLDCTEKYVNFKTGECSDDYYHYAATGGHCCDRTQCVLAEDLANGNVVHTVQKHGVGPYTEFVPINIAPKGQNGEIKQVDGNNLVVDSTGDISVNGEPNFPDIELRGGATTNLDQHGSTAAVTICPAFESPDPAACRADGDCMVTCTGVANTGNALECSQFGADLECLAERPERITMSLRRYCGTTLMDAAQYASAVAAGSTCGILIKTKSLCGLELQYSRLDDLATVGKIQVGSCALDHSQCADDQFLDIESTAVQGQHYLPDPEDNYAKIPNIGCGNCEYPYPTFGPNGERWQTATRDDVSSCKETCNAAAECGAFNFVEAHGRCYFRANNGDCARNEDPDRDCYVKTDSVPDRETCKSSKTRVCSYQYDSDTMPVATFQAALNSMDAWGSGWETLIGKWGCGRKEGSEFQASTTVCSSGVDFANIDNTNFASDMDKESKPVQHGYFVWHGSVRWYEPSEQGADYQFSMFPNFEHGAVATVHSTTRSGEVLTTEVIERETGDLSHNSLATASLAQTLKSTSVHHLAQGWHMVQFWGADSTGPGHHNYMFNRANSGPQALTEANLASLDPAICSLSFSSRALVAAPTFEASSLVADLRASFDERATVTNDDAHNDEDTDPKTCSQFVDSFSGISNHGPTPSNADYQRDNAVCGADAQEQDLLLRYHWFFTEAGGETYQFRVGADFGYGGFVTLDGSSVHLAGSEHDLWWEGDMSKTEEVLTSAEVVVAAGQHVLEVLGAEACCDGPVTIQYKRAGGDWTDVTSAGCPAPAALPDGMCDSDATTGQRFNKLEDGSCEACGALTQKICVEGDHCDAGEAKEVDGNRICDAGEATEDADADAPDDAGDAPDDAADTPDDAATAASCMCKLTVYQGGTPDDPTKEFDESKAVYASGVVALDMWHNIPDTISWTVSSIVIEGEGCEMQVAAKPDGSSPWPSIYKKEAISETDTEIIMTNGYGGMRKVEGDKYTWSRSAALIDDGSNDNIESFKFSCASV